MATLAIGAAPTKKPGAKKPVVLATQNGETTLTKVMERLKAGTDPLDALIEGLSVVESDPKDNSVGYGGLPNAVGIVEMDAAVMHGPTHAAGAVAGLRGILHPAAVARAVMQRTNNCLIVGDGAAKFARNCGFPSADLLTSEARDSWKTWRKLYDLNKNREPIPPELSQSLDTAVEKLSWHGSMLCLALDTHGDLAGVTTAPGLPFKIPGRVGDTPILGGGMFVDNDYGACISTGTGELNMLNCSSYQVVENLRRGMDPKAACLDVCARVFRTAKRNPRYSGKDGRLSAGVALYCLAKDGRVGGATLGQVGRMLVHDGKSIRPMALPTFDPNASKRVKA